MKRIILLSALALTACQKEAVEAPLDKPEQAIPQKPTEDSTPQDSTIVIAPETREELFFQRLVNACLRCENQCDVSEFNIAFSRTDELNSEHKKLYDQFMKRYPFLFHIYQDGRINIIYKIDNNAEIECYKFDYAVKNNLSENVSKMLSRLESFYANLREGMSEAEIAYTIHHVLTQETNYKETINSATVIGPIIDGTGICQGYSFAYSMLMECIGFETNSIRGSVLGIPHLWNSIKIGDYWYNMDSTWDDNHDRPETAACEGKYVLASDQLFYTTLRHERPYEIPPVPQATDSRFDSKDYFFRNNMHQSNAIYNNGFWYYMDLSEMCIYRSHFDGTNKQAVRKLNRSAKTDSRWKQIDFGDQAIYFIDVIDDQDFICSIRYDGTSFTKIKPITIDQLYHGMALKPTSDIPTRKTVGSVALRCQVALSKLKDAYYHGTEDYHKPIDPSRIAFVEAISEAEKFLKDKRTDENEADRLYKKLHQLYQNHTLPLTTSPK